MRYTYEKFLTRVIDEGIVAAKRDYKKPGDEHKLEGAIEGFNECRGKTPVQIYDLLVSERRKRVDLYPKQSGESQELKLYWRQTCKVAEVEWVANVLSAALESSGEQGIVPVTARGVLRAAEILNATEKEAAG